MLGLRIRMSDGLGTTAMRHLRFTLNEREEVLPSALKVYLSEFSPVRIVPSLAEAIHVQLPDERLKVVMLVIRRKHDAAEIFDFFYEK